MKALLLVWLILGHVRVASAQSLVDCITSMMFEDVDGDDALSYAEYLNLLIQLTTTAAAAATPTTTATTTATTQPPCNANAAAVILDNADSFQREFQGLACHCTDFYDDAVASVGASSGVTIPPCICRSEEDGTTTATTTTTTADSQDEERDTTTTTTTAPGSSSPPPTIALPGVYPGAYAVRVCDDITTQLLLLRAECLNLPPIYSPPPRATTVTTTAAVTRAPVSAPPTTDGVIVVPAAAADEQDPGTNAPTPFRSIKVPNFIAPAPEQSALPTSSPVSNIVTDSVIVDPAPSPSSGTATTSSNREPPTANTDDSNATGPNRQLAIALPLLIVASCVIFGLIIRHHRQEEQNRSSHGRFPRGSVKLEDHDADDNMDNVDDTMKGYATDLKSYSQSRRSQISSTDIEHTEVSETVTGEHLDDDYDDDDDDDPIVEHLFHDGTDDDQGHVGTATSPSPMTAARTARPHLNLILPTGQNESDNCGDEHDTSTGSGASGGELGIVCLTSSVSSLETPFRNDTTTTTTTTTTTATQSVVSVATALARTTVEKRPTTRIPAPKGSFTLATVKRTRSAMKSNQQTNTKSSSIITNGGNKKPQSTLMQTIDAAVNDERSRPTGDKDSVTTATAATTSSDALMTISNHSSSTGSSLNIFDDNTSHSSDSIYLNTIVTTMASSSPQKAPRLPPSSFLCASKDNTLILHGSSSNSANATSSNQLVPYAAAKMKLRNSSRDRLGPHKVVSGMCSQQQTTTTSLPLLAIEKSVTRSDLMSEDESIDTTANAPTASTTSLVVDAGTVSATSTAYATAKQSIKEHQRLYFQ